MQKQVVESAKAAVDALRSLAETLRRVRLFEKDAHVLKLQLSKMKKASDAEAANPEGLLKKGRAVEARVRLLCDKRDLSKRRLSRNCNLEVFTCEVADTQIHAISSVTQLHQNSVSLYDFVRRSANCGFAKVSSPVKKAFDREERSLQRGVRGAVLVAVESTRGLLQTKMCMLWSSTTRNYELVEIS